MTAWQPGAMRWVRPLYLALCQWGDPAFLDVLARSVVLAALCFAALGVGCTALLHRFVGLPSWGAGLIATVAAIGLALWLFLPVAVGIGLLYADRIAAAVDRRWYPHLPPPSGAPVFVQIWDGVALGVKVLVLQLLGLVLIFLLPGFGVVLGWAIAAWALGRGLFVAVAMRRMGRDAARMAYRSRRGAALAVGAVLVLVGMIPAFNLLIPIVGTATMVHLLHATPRRGLSWRSGLS